MRGSTRLNQYHIRTTWREIDYWSVFEPPEWFMHWTESLFSLIREPVLGRLLWAQDLGSATRIPTSSFESSSLATLKRLDMQASSSGNMFLWTTDSTEVKLSALRALFTSLTAPLYHHRNPKLLRLPLHTATLLLYYHMARTCVGFTLWLKCLPKPNHLISKICKWTGSPYSRLALHSTIKTNHLIPCSV